MNGFEVENKRISQERILIFLKYVLLWMIILQKIRENLENTEGAPTNRDSPEYEKQNNYYISDPNEVNGLFIGEEKGYYLFIVVELSSKKNHRDATKGVLSVYRLSELSKKYDTGNIGEKVLEVPIVSGGKEKINGKDVYYEPVAKGYYKNVKKQISGLDSGNQLLWDNAHGRSQNLILRLYKDFLIHQGNNQVTQENAYTQGCVSITAYRKNEDANGKTDVDRNYEQFRNLIWGGLDVDVEIK